MGNLSFIEMDKEENTEIQANGKKRAETWNNG